MYEQEGEADRQGNLEFIVFVAAYDYGNILKFVSFLETLFQIYTPHCRDAYETRTNLILRCVKRNPLKVSKDI